MAKGQEKKKLAFDDAESTQKVFMYAPENLKIDMDHPNPMQRARARLPVNEDLVKAFLHHKFRGAILIRKNGRTAEIVDGRQRVKAAVEANRRLKKDGKATFLIRCIQEFASSDASMELIATSMNNGQQKVTPLGEAQNVEYLLGLGCKEEEVASAIMQPLTRVKKLITLLSCVDKVKMAVESEQISLDSAVMLASLKRDDQLAELKTLLANAPAGGRATLEQVTRAVRQKTGKHTNSPPSKKVLKKTLEVVAKTLENEKEAGSPTETLEWLVSFLTWTTTGKKIGKMAEADVQALMTPKLDADSEARAS